MLFPYLRRLIDLKPGRARHRTKLPALRLTLERLDDRVAPSVTITSIQLHGSQPEGDSSANFNEGTPESAQLIVNFTTDFGSAPVDFTVDFGDGTTATGTAFAGGGTSSFTEFHTYDFADDNPSGTPSDLFTVSVSLSAAPPGSGSDSGTALGTVNNVAPTVTAVTPSATNINENDVLTLTVSFTDPGVVDDHTATVDWGDGSAQSTIAIPAADTTNYSFTLSHQYLDDNPTGTSSDSNTVSVVVTDDDTGTGSGSTALTVNDVAPTITGVALNPSAPTEGSPATLTVSFTDPGTQDTFTATIDWGDGATESVTIDTAGAPNHSFTVAHTYLDDAPSDTPTDAPTISVTVLDDDTLQATSTFAITVNTDTPSAVGVIASSNPVDEGSLATFSVTFSDPGTLETFTATVDFGDGTTQSATGSPGGTTHTITFTHQYVDDNPTGTSSDLASISVTVSDDDPGSGSGITAVTVNDVAPTVTGVSLNPTSLTEGSSTTLTVSFTDPGIQDTFTATVNWGDGTSTDTVSVGTAQAPNHSFTLSHVYADDNSSGAPPNVFTLSVTVQDDDTLSGTGGAQVTVSNVPPTITGLGLSPRNLNEGQTATLTVSFTDPGTQDTHTATINWGDGSATNTVSAAAGVTSFSISHLYADDNPTGTPSDVNSVIVTVADDDGGRASGPAALTVNNVAPGAPSISQSTFSIAEPGAVTITVTFSDAGVQDTHTATVDWDDGAANAVAVAAGVTSFAVGHTYAAEALNSPPHADTITVTLVDDDTGQSSGTSFINLTPPIDRGPSYVVGAGFGGGPRVRAFNADGSVRFDFFAYTQAFNGGVRVALADVNGDGTTDIITGAGVTGGPHVKVFDGRTGQLMLSFFAFDLGFSGGLYVAGGDVNGDGRADIVVGAGSIGGPHVRVFSGADLSLLGNFFAYDPNFRGGVRVATADVTGDGIPDIITGAGLSGGPHVKVIDGTKLSEVTANGMISDSALYASFFAYDQGFQGGVFVSAADVNGDGKADVITTPDVNGGPHLRVFDGATLAPMLSEFAYDSTFAGGVRVAALDTNHTGHANLLVVQGSGGNGLVKIIDGRTGVTLGSFNAFDPGFLGSVYVGAMAPTAVQPS
ncbi:MAG: FG-GAP-like repeat-containing protein [Gemmataceae bacterium]